MNTLYIVILVLVALLSIVGTLDFVMVVNIVLNRQDEQKSDASTAKKGRQLKIMFQCEDEIILVDTETRETVTIPLIRMVNSGPEVYTFEV